jgi:hypothetical protein
MGKHKLAAGAEVISSLVLLGKTLGYVTKEEFPTEQTNRSGPVVDVAWLSDERQRFPIMIFEIESKASNSAAYNPVKVFGPPNEQFEKPLFFFHIFVTGGARTSRLKNLRSSFGTHNYRNYRLQAGEIQALLKDILSQHRRLTVSLDVVSLVERLESIPRFRPYISEVLVHAELLSFHVDYLVSYAVLAKARFQYLDQFIRHLHSLYNATEIEPPPHDYSTFIGGFYAAPVHLGILHCLESSHRKKWFAELQKWQESSSELTQIGPHFNLSYDYDQFILGLAGPFWALIACLMRSNDEATRYILRQCWLILDAVQPSPFSAFLALWGLHIAAATYSIDDFEQARTHINDLGGLARSYLYAPPSAIHLEGEDEWFEAFQISPQPVPDLETFIKQHPYRLTEHDQMANLRFALSVLLDDSAFYEWSSSIVAALAPIDLSGTQLRNTST